jgi:hypothetical protein
MKLAQITGINPPAGSKFTNSTTLAGDVASRAILFAIALAGLYFFFQLITSGVSFMTSMGDEGKIKNAQKQVTNAGFGLIIIICAFFLMQIIQKITGISVF